VTETTSEVNAVVPRVAENELHAALGCQLGSLMELHRFWLVRLSGARTQLPFLDLSMACACVLLRSASSMGIAPSSRTTSNPTVLSSPPLLLPRHRFWCWHGGQRFPPGRGFVPPPWATGHPQDQAESAVAAAPERAIIRAGPS